MSLLHAVEVPRLLVSRLLVITGDAGFFAITKRLHNQIHGRLSGAPLGDVVLLHDPQTAGPAAG